MIWPTENLAMRDNKNIKIKEVLTESQRYKY